MLGASLAVGIPKRWIDRSDIITAFLVAVVSWLVRHVDQLNLGANHKLGRIWNGQVNMGYAHNTPIRDFGPSISQTYNTWNFWRQESIALLGNELQFRNRLQRNLQQLQCQRLHWFRLSIPSNV